MPRLAARVNPSLRATIRGAVVNLASKLANFLKKPPSPPSDELDFSIGDDLHGGVRAQCCFSLAQLTSVVDLHGGFLLIAASIVTDHTPSDRIAAAAGVDTRRTKLRPDATNTCCASGKGEESEGNLRHGSRIRKP